jgi:dihydroflavonol-4-reductase
MEGCRYVLHLASPASLNLPKDPNDTIKPAVNGALAVLRAALLSGVQRVVITSSGSVAQHSLEKGPGEMRTENDWTALRTGKRQSVF